MNLEPLLTPEDIAGLTGMNYHGVLRAIRQAGVYIDPVNRHRDQYLAGETDVEEFERRVEATLRESSEAGRRRVPSSRPTSL